MLSRLAFALLLIASAGGDGAATGDARGYHAATHTITIDKMAFAPAPANLHVGDTIIWVNHDLFRHTATADDRSFDMDIAPGKSARTVLAKAGIVSFHCTYHPGMKGTLVIIPARALLAGEQAVSGAVRRSRSCFLIFPCSENPLA